MPSILFICIHNACRSQMAEAICKSMAPGSWQIASAGTRPSAQVDPKAAQTLRQHGLEMTSTTPKGFADLPARPWDYVIGMGCGDRCPYVPAKKFVEWDVADPLDGPWNVYESLFENLTRRVRQLIQEIQNNGKKSP